MVFNNYSTTNSSSGYSSENFTPWAVQESWPDFQSVINAPNASGRTRSSSFADFPTVPNKMDVVMEEFRMNGSDSPYEPEKERAAMYRNTSALAGMGPSSMYLRQKSWPDPEATPSVPLQYPDNYNRQAGDMMAAPDVQAKVGETLPANLNDQNLSIAFMQYLLRELEQKKAQESRPRKQPLMECRFCKNNGERESYYRSHRLRWRGRVTCPVLRAYSCRRCGAKGDSAHTLKYCPLTSDDERIHSSNMMRSVRMASGRRRNNLAPSIDDARNFAVYGEVTPSVIQDGAVDNTFVSEPLDPLWEALAKKLMLC